MDEGSTFDVLIPKSVTAKRNENEGE
jgi:hypothetical protein